MLDFIKYFDPMSAISRGTEEYRANEKAQSDRLLAKIQAEMQRQQILAKQQEMSHAAQRQPLDLAELRAITEGRSLANRESRGKLDAIDLVGGNQYRARNLLREESKADRQATADFVKNLPAYGAISKYLPDVQQPAFLSSAMNQGGLPTPRQNINPQEVPGIFETMSKEIQNTEGYGASQSSQAKYAHEIAKQKMQDEAAMARTKVTAGSHLAAAGANQITQADLSSPSSYLNASARKKLDPSFDYRVGTYKANELKQIREAEEQATGKQIPPSQLEKEWQEVANRGAEVINAKAKTPEYNIPGMTSPVSYPSLPTGERNTGGATGSFAQVPPMPKDFAESYKKLYGKAATPEDWVKWYTHDQEKKQQRAK